MHVLHSLITHITSDWCSLGLDTHVARGITVQCIGKASRRLLKAKSWRWRLLKQSTRINELLSVPILTHAIFRGDLHMSHDVKFQPNRTICGRVITIPPFYSLLLYLGSHLRRCYSPSSLSVVSVVAGQRRASGVQKDNFHTVGQCACRTPHIWKLLTPFTGNAQNGKTILPVANLMADSESGSLVSYSSKHRSVSRNLGHICVWHTDGQTDNADHYYSLADPTLWRAS